MLGRSSLERGEGDEGGVEADPAAGGTAESTLRWGVDVSTLLMGRSPRLSFFGEGGDDGFESDDIPDMISPLSSMDASQVPSTTEHGDDDETEALLSAHGPAQSRRPEEHQQTDAGSSSRSSGTAASIFNSVNAMLGVGLLGYPFVMKLGGWATAGLLFIFALICNHTGKLLGVMMDVRSPIRLRDGPHSHIIVGFSDLARVAFGRGGALLVSVLFLGETFGYGCIHLLVEADNLHKLLGNHPWFIAWGQREFLVLSFLLLLPLYWLRKLSLLSYFSALGAMSGCLLFLGVAVSGLEESEPNRERCPLLNCTGSLIHPSQTEVARWDSLPSVVGLGMVGFVGHAVFPTIRNDMADKRDYPKVINVAYVIATILYVGIGCCGYLMFGDYSAEMITLNLGDTWFSQLTVWIVVANPLTKFPLSMAPLGLGCEQMAMRLLGLPARGGVVSREGAAVGDSRSGKPLWIKIARTIVSVVVRTLLALAALAIVTAIPSFGLFMDVIGATCSFSLAVTLPSLYYVRLFWGSLTPFKRLAHCALVAFGILSSVMGTYASIQRHAHANPSEG